MFHVPAGFWEQFAIRSAGATRPAVLDVRNFPEALFSPEDGVGLARQMVALADLSVNIGGSLRNDPHLVPPPVDAIEYASFVDRFAAANDAETITFTRDYCFKYSPQLARKVRAFIHGFVRTRGVPTPGVNGVFIGGRYRATWIGLHNDFCDTFLVPAIGRKEMLLWPPAYFQNEPLIRAPSLNGICYGHVDLAPYRRDASVFPVEPGEILFIPANWWHYNDLPAPELTMTLSLGVFANASTGDVVQRAMNAALALTDAGRLPIASSLIEQNILSKDLTEVSVDARADRTIEAARYFLRLHALLASSCCGVLGCAEYRNVAPGERFECIVGLEDSAIYLVTGEDRCLLIAGGSVRRAVDSPGLRDLVRRVNAHVPFAISELREVTDDVSPLLDVLAWLYSMGCIELGPAAEAGVPVNI